MTGPRVTDHAVLRYLELVVGLDIEALRAEIGANCARSQGAPCVRTTTARYIVRGTAVVTVLSGEAVPSFKLLADVARTNAAIAEAEAP